MTEEERRQRLIAMGLDPEEYTYQTAEEKAYEDTTALGAVGTGVRSAIGPTLGTAVGAVAPWALGLTGPVGIGVGVVGGGILGYLGGKGQEAAEDAALDDAEQQALALQRQVAYEKHPWLTFAGQAAPSMAFFRPSPTVLKNVFGAVKNAPLGTQTALQRYALGNVAIGGGLEAGVDLGVQAMGDEDIDWGRVAGAGALGGLLTEPTRAFGKVGATLSRSGLDAKPWLEEKGMTRPLTEIEAAKYALAKGEEHTKAVNKNREETDKAILEYSVNKDARKLVKKPDFHSLDELREAGKQAAQDVADTKKAAGIAAKSYDDIQKQFDNILKSNPTAHETRQLRNKVQTLQKASEDASVKHREALDEETALNKQIADLTAKTAKAIDNAYDRDKRNRNRTGVPEGPKPTDSDYFKSVQGLMAKQGMTMNEAVADLKGRDDKGTFDIKGEYDIQAHAVTLNKLHNEDTPWHEYLHGTFQVLKRSPNPKHQRLTDYLETGIFKDDPTYKKMIADGKSLAERTAWTEEQGIQRAGKILEKRMSNPPEGFIGGLKKWFSDWRLERDAATGFQPKYTDKKSIDADNLLDRMAEWIAMRGERQPALQPKQIDAMLADLAVKSPYDNFDSVLGRSRYARDIPQPDEAPDEMRSRVGNIIRESLAATKSDSISKGHINNLIAAAKKSNKILDEDVRWNSQLLKNFEDYEGKKIPREKVEEFLDAFEYRVTTLENRTDFPKPPLDPEKWRSGFGLRYIGGDRSRPTNVIIENPDLSDPFRAGKELMVNNRRRKAGEPFITENRGGPYMTEAEARDFVVDRYFRDLNKERAEYGKIDKSKSGYLPYEGIAMIQGENYKTRVLRMPDKYTDPEYIGKMGHSEFGAGKNTIGWVRSNEQYLVSDGSKSKHIVEGQSDLHQEGKALGYGTDRKLHTERHAVAHMSTWNHRTQWQIGGADGDGRVLADDVYTLKPFRQAHDKYGPHFKLPKQVQVSQAELDAEALELGERMNTLATKILRRADLTSIPFTEHAQPREILRTIIRDAKSWAEAPERTKSIYRRHVDKITKFNKLNERFNQLKSNNSADQAAVQLAKIRPKLKKDPEFTYGGYKFKYDAEADVLEQTPYVQKFTEADLVVDSKRAYKAIRASVISIRLPFAYEGQNYRIAVLTPDDFPNQQAFDNATREDIIATWLKGETDDPMIGIRTMPYHLGPGREGISMELTYDSDGPSFEAVLEPAGLKDKGKRIPDVPFKGNKYVSALARDTVMSAVRDGNESVTWPATIEEINATQRYGGGFNKSYKTGEPSSIYNLYVHGRQSNPNNSATYDFKGDGSGKQSLFDEAFNKIIKDYKEYKWAKGWKVEEDALMYKGVEGKKVPVKPDDPLADAAWPALKTIKVHKLKIPPELRDMLLREGGIESPRYQRVNAEELVGALKVVAMHDSSVQYSKRVRDNMMKRIKSGTYTVEQGQKALARFASKPFPAEMSGEEIAQVVNGLEMYHGSTEAAQVMREGFKGEELSLHSALGRGIYMTPSHYGAEGYAGERLGKVLSIRTNFKKLFNFNLLNNYSARLAFMQKYEKAADVLGYPLTDKAKNNIKSNALRQGFGGRTKERTALHIEDFTRVGIDAFKQTSKLQADIDAGLEGVDIRNRVLGSMGYDGLTIAPQQGPGRLREVVAFREPFQKATDQLQEYYGSKRLQRMDADEYLGDVKDYQLTSYTDHYASNPAAKRPWFLDSVVDRIRMTGETAEERRASAIVSDAFAATARDAQTLDGQFIQNFELVEQTLMKLSPADAEQVQIYMAHARRTDPVTGELTNPIPAETLARYNEPNSVVKHYVEWFRKQYTEARRLDIEAGVKIYHPKTGELTDPGSYPEYSPEVINQTKWRELSGNDATKRDAAKKELADWWKTHRVQDKTHKNYISDEDIKEAVDAYVARLAGGDMAHLGSTKFGALRKAEGIGLPLTKGEDGRFNWIEPSAANTFTSYFRRWSKDHSFFKNVEQNPDARAILGLKNPTTGEHVPTYTTGKNPFHVETTTLADGREINKAQTTDKNIKDFIKSYLGYYDGEELFGRTANRLVVSHWLGLMSGIRDLGSSYVFTLPHLRGQDMGLIISSLKDFSKSWIQSHLYGVNKTHANRIEFATETHNKLADLSNRWADIVSKYSGRTPLERITRAAQFGLGRAVVMKHMGVVKGTDITVDRNMRRLGSMSGVDINLLRRHADKADDFKLDDKTLDDALDRMAASWVEANQGTYDARGVPAWTMSGSMSMYTSLARWNIEKFNTMKQEVVRPMMDEGDYRPLIKSTLGAVFTGTLLIELAEYINNKFRSNPTLEEAFREGDEEEIAYAVADSISYAGYFGVASALGNDMVNFARGQRPQGAGVVFPAWDFISQSLTEPIFDAVTAIEEGEDPVPTVFKAIHETIRNTHQTYRIIWNNDMLGLLPLGREQVNDQNIRRDLRIFRRFEGIRGVAPVGGLGNRMLRPKTREFKEADTIEEAQAALPEAFEEQRRRAKGRGDKLKSYAQGLYAIPDKTLPSPSTLEGVEEFMRYREYLTRQRGDMYWQRIFNDWVRNREAMTPAKKLLVKQHVQRLIQQSPST